MKITPSNLVQVTLLCLVLFLNFSCNKDSDLLAEYVVNENPTSSEPNEVIIDLAKAEFITEEDQPVTFNLLNNSDSKRKGRRRYKSNTKPKIGDITIEKDSIAVYTPPNDYNGKDNIEITLEVTNEDETITEEVVTIDVTVEPVTDVVVDTIAVTPGEPVVIEPLKNDTFKEESEVIITEVSQPSNGTVVLNEDNTITYNPNTDIPEEETPVEETPEVETPEEDNFTYTTSVTNPDNTVSTETGNITVTVTPTDKTPTDPNAVNFSKYGAVGDGKKDDTKAIQAALDAEESLVADEGATFLISSKLDIDQKFE
ncbi:Ig-like domain-containing protein, partial [Arenibacter sp. M-2]|uniref:Ig-like domain-containing protein n=1 Tax=Arenibacter sp. M-2 TaxID=3053612 RepID=UPI002570E45F